MKTHNAPNERIKRAYFSYLREAKRNSEQTPFSGLWVLSNEQAIDFKNHLAKQQGRLLSRRKHASSRKPGLVRPSQVRPVAI